MAELLIAFFERSTPVTYLVIGVLSLYLVLTIWIFIYRYLFLSKWLSKESSSLERLHLGSTSVSSSSIIKSCLKKSPSLDENLFKMCQYAATKEATKGLTTLSLIASTSPFVGLFGTVVHILEAFAGLGTQKSATLSVVAPAISEALIATAAGIFVAIFAYSFHLLLKRKAFELTTVIAMECDLLLSSKKVQ